MLYILVGVGRLPELFDLLQYLFIGKIAIVITIIGFFKYKGDGAYKISDSNIFNITQILFFLCVLSVPMSIWVSYSFHYLTSVIFPAYLFLLFIAMSSVNLKTIHMFIFALILCALILTFKTLSLTAVGRLTVGSSYDPNDLAQVLVTLLPLFIYKIYITKYKRQVLYILGLGALLVAILFTGSRGGILGLIVVSGYLLLKLSNSKKSFFKVLTIITIGSMFAMMMAPSTTVDRFNSLFSLEDDYNVTGEKGRLAIWGRGLTTVIDRPIGVGVGAFGSAEGRAGGRHKAAHNIFLQIGVELGILGFVIFSMILWRSFKVLRSINYDEQTRVVEQTDISRGYALLSIILRASLLGYLVTGFFLSSGYTSLLFSIIAIIMALKINWDLYLKNEVLDNSKKLTNNE